MIYFIVNITARTGKSRAIWLEMKEILENRSIEYKAFQTRYAGHATDLARKISSLPEDRIYLITVGGDGTLNEVING
ncbi:MAG: acylglycerol kinase family protein, partial [Coprococcus sp.]